MTLLVSQVEALRENISFPFIHDWETSLHYGNLIENLLDKENIDFISNYTVVNAEAVQQFMINFNTAEQIQTYLKFEELYVKAEVLKNIHSASPRKRFWLKNPAPVNAETVLNQLHKSYRTAMGYLIATVPREEMVEETFN